MNLRTLLVVTAVLNAGILPAQSSFWNADAGFAPVFDSPTAPLNQQIAEIARLPDGKLLASGYVERVNGEMRPNPLAPLRFNADGSWDKSFNADAAVARLFVQPDGKIVSTNGIRLNANGTPDPTFEAPADLRQIEAVDSSGRLYGWLHDNTLIRMTADGRDDGQFRGTLSGLPTGRIAPFADGSVAVALVQPTYPRLTFTRLKADGSEDTAFKRYTDSLQPDTLYGLVALPDGRVLLYGSTLAQYGMAMRFVRLGPDGLPDFIYVSPGSNSTAPSLTEALTLAGVIYDSLRDAGASSSVRVRTTFDAGTFSASLDVGADGTLSLATNWPTSAALARYVRVPGTGPTIDPRPTIVYEFTLPTMDRVVGEPFLLGAPSPGGLLPVTYQWMKDGQPIAGATRETLSNQSPATSDAGTYTVVMSNAYGSVTSKPMVVAIDATPAPLTITQPLANQTVRIGSTLLWWTYARGTPYPTFTWTRNGAAVSAVRSSSGRQGASSVQIMNVQPEHAGIYEATVTSGENSQRMTAILGVVSETKTAGTANEIGADIVHPNGNIYDQVLLSGGAASITADPQQITRLSFVDLSDDIVQVEMSGAGTLTITLEGASAPAPAVNYNQPSISYVKGHASIVVTGADESTYVTVFSVGRKTALNQTLFRDDVDYDGIADIASIAISSPTGRFGGLRAGNVHFNGTRGLTGVYAPGVAIEERLAVGNIQAFDDATPVLLVGSAREAYLTGGDLEQPNGTAPRLEGVSNLQYVDGATSHGEVLPAGKQP